MADTKNIDKRDTLANQSRGAATQYSDKYNVSSSQYPNDLFNNNNEYGGNYVIFYINIQSDSKFAPTEDGTIITDAIPPRLRGDTVGMGLGKTEATVGAGLATAVPTMALSTSVVYLVDNLYLVLLVKQV